jgi:hypothetical protein
LDCCSTILLVFSTSLVSASLLVVGDDTTNAPFCFQTGKFVSENVEEQTEQVKTLIPRCEYISFVTQFLRCSQYLLIWHKNTHLRHLC